MYIPLAIFCEFDDYGLRFGWAFFRFLLICVSVLLFFPLFLRFVADGSVKRDTVLGWALHSRVRYFLEKKRKSGVCLLLLFSVP